MPLKVPTGLPALDAVRAEGVKIEEFDTVTPDTFRVALLNIMPTKETTEADFIRLLAGSSHNIELTLVKLDTHVPKNASPEHMARYYKGFGEVRKQHFDGFIITGAPIEKLEYEQVTYWPELQEIFDWAKENVTSTLYICWAAQAILYHRFSIPKYLLEEKMFGIFPHRILREGVPLFAGFEKEFFVPHSRHTEIRREDILAEERIELLSESDESGVYIVTERGTRDFFITGHSEYALYTLDGEYKRDVAKGLPIKIPRNYYLDDNPQLPPVDRWSDHAIKIFNNWIDCYLKK
ncbi:MAG: homoserine O-succinyltransferase [Bacteroidales bacterium]|nr:homoserine O-succinyltransferase [Bacteroidales bacterium]MBR2607917.1 homoserine O-succinyltransferase [Bacteroidaceae bacterium]